MRRKSGDDEPFDGVVDEPDEVFLTVALNEVAALETREAELHWDVISLRERVAELEATLTAAGIDWFEAV